MPQFVLPDLQEFDGRDGLISLVKLSVDCFYEIRENQKQLIILHFRDDDDRALQHAVSLAQRLIEAIQRLPETPGMSTALDDYGLQGPALHFKLRVIAYAVERCNEAQARTLERLQDPSRRGWFGGRPYRLAMKKLLEAIDGPLESLTKAFGISEGLVEFKKALEWILGIRSDVRAGMT